MTTTPAPTGDAVTDAALHLALFAQVAATLFMTGLIWFVQVVHYPLFAMVGIENGPGYAASHQRRTTWVVGPPMLVELAAAAALAVLRPGPMTIAGLALVILIWISTAFAMVPCHQRLLAAHDPPTISRLVRGNWLRTLAWTTRATLALAMLHTPP